VQIKKLLLILIALHVSVVEAVAGPDLYSGEVAVPSQAEEDRNHAVPDALIQVLQKLSGRRDLPLTAELDEALGNANRMLLSYRYTNFDRIGPDGIVNEELRLIASFMQPEVDRLVQQIGLPRWQQERPAVQLWVVVDDGQSRELKPVELEYAWQSMQDIAMLRGLPVSWPELDEEEVQLIDMRLVWGGFTDYLVERGAPGDGVAIVAARREGPQWSLRWNIVSGKQKLSWSNSDRELLFALAQGIHWMADRIAEANTIAATEQGSRMVEVAIGGLNSADDYVACLDYLQNLSLVTAVSVLAAEPGQVRFRLEINAPSNYLSATLRRGTVLLPARAGSKYDYEFLR
jgi:hypothetical protein